MHAAPFGSDRADGVLYEASGWPEIGAFLFGAPSNSAASVPPANIVKARAFLWPRLYDLAAVHRHFRQWAGDAALAALPCAIMHQTSFCGSCRRVLTMAAPASRILNLELPHQVPQVPSVASCFRRHPSELRGVHLNCIRLFHGF